MSDCRHRAYPTSISARHAAKMAGGKGLSREVEKCRYCGRWRIKEGLV